MTPAATPPPSGTPPQRPLPAPRWWRWQPRTPGEPWTWARVYHRDQFTRDGVDHRTYGPINRFDHLTGDFFHRAECAEHRAVLYVGASLRVSLAEAFRERDAIGVCPNFRVALVEPVTTLTLIEIATPAACARIGAPADLGPGDLARVFTQDWARAMWADCPLPTGEPADGVHYTARFGKGPALALWNTRGRVRTTPGAGGVPQDFSLHELWGRVVVEFDALGKDARREPECTCHQEAPTIAPSQGSVAGEAGPGS